MIICQLHLSKLFEIAIFLNVSDSGFRFFRNFLTWKRNLKCYCYGVACMFAWNFAEWWGKILGKQTKKKLTWGKTGKFGLLWVKIFKTLYLSVHSRVFFFFDIFYILTFWETLCPFFNDNIYEMWLLYFWWNFGWNAIGYVISYFCFSLRWVGNKFLADKLLEKWPNIMKIVKFWKKLQKSQQPGSKS